MRDTLDEYLFEVDKWKKSASERMSSLDEASRLAYYKERRRQFEIQLKRQLQVREDKPEETVVAGLDKAK